MELRLQKNTAAELMFPMVDSAAPASFKSGLTVTDTGYYKDGAGSWTALSITDTVTEIGTTGMYTLELTAGEMNHDLVMIKMTGSGAADSAIIIRTTPTVSNVTEISGSAESSDTLGAANKNFVTETISSSNINKVYGSISTPTSLTSAISVTGSQVSFISNSILATGASAIGANITGNNVTGKANIISSSGTGGAAVSLSGNNSTIEANLVYSSAYDAIISGGTNTTHTVVAEYIYGGSNALVLEGTNSTLVVEANTIYASEVINYEGTGTIIVKAQNITAIDAFIIASVSGTLEVCSDNIYVLNTSLEVPQDIVCRIYGATIHTGVFVGNGGELELIDCVVLGAVIQSGTGIIKYNSNTQFRSTITGTLIPIGLASNTVTGTSIASDVGTEIASAVWSATLSLPGQVAPSNTPSASGALTWMYKLSRNKTTSTSSLISVYDDAGTTVDNKATVSDNGTTFTREEFGAGP